MGQHILVLIFYDILPIFYLDALFLELFEEYVDLEKRQKWKFLGHRLLERIVIKWLLS